VRQGPRRIAIAPFAALVLLAAVGAAAAQTPPPAPYSLPWQLRPATAGNVLRLEETVALYEMPSIGESGRTLVTTLTGSWKLSPRWAPVARVAWVSNDPGTPDRFVASGPPREPSGSAFSNPLIGVTYARSAGAWKQAGFAAVVLPLGQGGGDAPDAGAAAAVARGIPARSSMDNALFAVNYCSLVAGASVARVDRALTAQAEVTVLRLLRARGPETGDAARTNSMLALHLGRFVTPALSVGADVRYQRWLTEAAAVRANATARENVTFAVGPRFHFRVGDRRFLRPGIAWARSTDRPFSSASYDMIQVDVPWAF
jgi:hypothetical protein